MSTTLAQMLRGYADKVANFPTEATKFLAGPTSFLDAVTGKMNMPEEKGFSQGFFGVEPDKNLTVLDPNNVKYMEGYDIGEPFGYAAIASPFVAAGANKLSNKAVQTITKNPFATDIGVIDYASKFSPVKMAQELKKNDLNFFSTLDEAVNSLPQAKGTGQQYMAQLLKTPAVKQEELIYRGLDKFLEQNPKVTKQEIQDYLHTNPVKLKETVLDDGYIGKQRTDLVEDYRLRDGDIVDDYDYIESRADDYLMEFKEDLPLRKEVMDDILARNADDFSDYTINPSTAERLEREVDDALYERAYAQAKDEYYYDPYMRYTDDYGAEIVGNDEVGYIIRAEDGRDITPRNGVYSLNDAEFRLREHHLEQGNLNYEPEGGPKYADYQTDGPSKNYREVLIQLEDKVPQIGVIDHPTLQGKYSLADAGTGKKYVTGADGQPIAFDTKEKAMASPLFQRYRNQVEPVNYQSGHFDEENILAHMRVNDRIIDGKKSLFIEEIQSDWHQQGRKKGYASSRTVAQIDKEMDAIVNELRSKPNVEYAPTQEDWARYPELSAKHDALSNERANAPRSDAVPDAPYKKNWQEMAVRRAIQMAVDQGYDRVAFTTGKQQAERYNLSKQVDKIVWMPYESNGSNKVVRIQPKNANTIELRLSPEGKVMNGGQFADKTIDEVIGKDIAKKVMDANTGDLSGVNLDIGGEGMKGFYDKILPEYINKYGKKYGIKVGKTNLGKEPDFVTWAEEKHPELHSSFIVHAQKNKNTSDLWNEYLADIKANPPKGEEIHYFDITPEAKKSLLEKGSPLFAIPPAAAMTEEESRKEMLERLFQEQQK
jgi:hypothetical protein